MSFWNFINGAAVLGITGFMAVGYGIADSDIDTTTTGAIAPPESADRMMVVDHAGNRTCMVSLQRADGYDVHRLLTGHCDNMPAKLTAARTWQDTEPGKVRITDRRGNVLMRLSADDRYGWKVVEPAGLSISFEAL